MSSSAPSDPPPIRLLFVCLGNICRSPMAHAVAQHQISTLPSNPPSTSTPTFHLDSAGTGAYHAGSDPDPRTISTLRKHGITDFQHAARKIRTSDFWDFDHVLAMDEENLADLEAVRGRAEREGPGKGKGKEERKLAKLAMFGDYGGKGKGEVVEDPWYGGGKGFEVAYEQCVRMTKGLLEEVLGKGMGEGKEE